MAGMATTYRGQWNETWAFATAHRHFIGGNAHVALPQSIDAVCALARRRVRQLWQRPSGWVGHRRRGHDRTDRNRRGPAGRGGRRCRHRHASCRLRGRSDPRMIVADQRIVLLTLGEVVNTVRALIDDTEANALL